MTKVKTKSGQVFENVHRPSLCEGTFCTFHNPSPHHMNLWPLQTRHDRAFMHGEHYLLLLERICPHGVGHPDPDSREWLDSVYPQGAWGIHGCCAQRCCSEKYWS